MLRTRIAVAILFIPIIVALVMAGGYVYLLAVVLVLGLGAWELNGLMRAGGYAPSLTISLLLMGVILLSFVWPDEDVLKPGLALCIVLAMYWGLQRYRLGNKAPLLNFSLTLGAGLYLGWLGAHLLTLRALPDGAWWTLTVIPAIFAADTGAYAIGIRYGRHKLMPVVSPKKTWEGYLGGVAFAVIFGLVFAGLWGLQAPRLTALHGAFIGVLVALVSPLGDLTISSFKRQVGVKDASRLIPGHGGVLDRLDSVLIGIVVGYYYILWFT